MNREEIRRIRALVTSATYQFASYMQPIKEVIIDKIVEQTLFFSSHSRGLTEQEIRDTSAAGIAYANPVLKHEDIHQSVMRLLEMGRVVPVKNYGVREHVYGPERFVLSPEARVDQQHTCAEYESRLKRVVTKLFKHAIGGSERYRAAFLDCLCQIFVRVGASNVRLLVNDITDEDSNIVEGVRRAIEKTLQRHKTLNGEYFEKAIYRFLREADPDYSNIKWHMAQTYFVAAALGLDASSRLLSKELFGGTTLVLDTNVLIAAVESGSKHNLPLHALLKACKELNIEVQACEVSLDEMSHVAAWNEELLKKVENQIPPELYDEVGDIFFQLFRREKEAHGVVDFDALFANLHNAKDILAHGLGVNVVDEDWFRREWDTPQTQKYAASLMLAYKQMRRREKKPNAARHDALLIRWVLEQRRSTGQDSRILSIDTSLPRFRPPDGPMPKPPVAINLSALMQWVSTVQVTSSDDDDAAFVFSEIFRLDILPREQVLHMQEIRMLADVGVQCANLPADDVRDLLLELRDSASMLDPSNPRELPKIALIVQKFFSDPSRSYKQEVAVLEKTIIEMQHDHKRSLDAKEAEHEKEKKVLQDTVDALQHGNATISADIAKSRLRAKGKRKLLICATFLLISEISWVWLFTASLPSHDWWTQLGAFLPIMGIILTAWLMIFTILTPVEEREVLGFDPRTIINLVMNREK